MSDDVIPAALNITEENEDQAYADLEKLESDLNSGSLQSSFRFEPTLCSGVIISNFTMLTSAQCCQNIDLRTARIMVGPEMYERSIKSTKLHQEFETGVDDDHPNSNDLCLLQLDKDILNSGGERLNTGFGFSLKNFKTDSG